MIFAPLLAALCAGAALAGGGARDRGGGAAGRHGRHGDVGARARRARRPRRAGRVPLPGALWLLYAALSLTAAALGAIDIAVPAAAREHGHFSAAGVLLAAMAVATVAGSLLAGRRPLARPAGVARGRADGADGGRRRADRDGDRRRSRCSALALLVPGAMLGALFATAYLLADRLAPAGSGTRVFAWLVTANNGGLALGAAVAGALSEGSKASRGAVVRSGLRARRGGSRDARPR